MRTAVEATLPAHSLRGLFVYSHYWPRPRQSNAVYENVGEPTEAALRVLVEKVQTDDSKFNAALDRQSPVERCGRRSRN